MQRCRVGIGSQNGVLTSRERAREFLGRDPLTVRRGCSFRSSRHRGGVSEPGYWRVAIAVPAEDVDGVRFGAPQVIASERHAVITEDLADGVERQTELVLDVWAKTHADALSAASEVYRRVREAANLSAADADIVFLGVLSPLFLGEIWDRLWDEAEQLHHDGRHDLAVIRAQTALECQAREAIAGFLARRLERANAEAVMRLCRASLNDGRTQRLLHEMSAFAPRKFNTLDWWEPYQQHLQGRHNIVHRGFAITEGDAQASLDAVEDCIGWLRELWAYG